MKSTRRDFLVLAPAAALAATPAVANCDHGHTLPGNDALLLDLERRRDETIQAWNAAVDASSRMANEAFDAWGEAVNELDELITATPAEGREGLLVKWRNVTYWHDMSYSGEGPDGAVDAFETDLLRIVGGRHV